MLLIDALLLLNTCFGRNMHKMRYFSWKIAKIVHDVIRITSPKNITKITSQKILFLGPLQSKFLAILIVNLCVWRKWCSPSSIIWIYDLCGGFQRTHWNRLFICSFFILLSRESDGSAMFWTNPHPLRSCRFLNFPVVSLTSYYWIFAFSKPPSRDNRR